MEYQKSLKIILRVANVLSRNQPPLQLHSTYIPVGGGGGYTRYTCILYIFILLFMLASTNSRMLAERIGYSKTDYHREAQEYRQHWYG